MTLCTQCGGKKIMQGQEMNVQVSGAAQSFFTAQGSAPPPVTCSQCNGNGYY